MGRLPEYRSKNILPPADTAGPQRAQLRARGDQAIGQAVADIGARLVQAEIATTRLKNDNYIKETSNKMEQFFNDRHIKTVQEMNDDPELQKKGSEFYEKQLDDDYNQFMNEQLKLAPNGRAAEVITQGADAAYNAQRKRTQMSYYKALQTRSDRNTAVTLKDLNMKAYRSPGRKNLEALKAELAAATKIYDLTLDPDQARMQRIQANQKLAASMMDGLLDQGKVSAAKKWLRSENIDDELGADAVSAYERRIKAMERANKAKQVDMQMMRFKRPWEYAKRIGLNPPQVDLNTPEGWNKLGEFIEMVKPKVPLPVLTPQMEYFYSNNFQNLEPQAQREHLAMFNQVDPVVRGMFAKRMSEINPTMTSAMMLLANGDDKSRYKADKILQGYKMTQKNPDTGKPAVTLPDRGEFNTIVNKQLQGLADNETFLSAIGSGAYSMYIKDQLDAGKDTSKIVKTDVQNTVKKLVGPMYKTPTSVLVSWTDKQGNHIPEDTLEEIYKSITNETLQQVMGERPKFIDGKEVDINGYRDNLVFDKVRGAGKFRVSMKSGSFIQPLFTKDKKPYIIDLKKYHKSGVKPQPWYKKEWRDWF